MNRTTAFFMFAATGFVWLPASACSLVYRTPAELLRETTSTARADAAVADAAFVGTVVERIAMPSEPPKEKRGVHFPEMYPYSVTVRRVSVLKGNPPVSRTLVIYQTPCSTPPPVGANVVVIVQGQQTYTRDASAVFKRVFRASIEEKRR
jgi:hypothetical protein